MDLSGWSLSGAVAFTFADGTTLDAGEYLVVAEDRDHLETVFPDARIVGNFTRRLSRRGETLVLEDAQDPDVGGAPGAAAPEHKTDPRPVGIVGGMRPFDRPDRAGQDQDDE